VKHLLVFFLLAFWPAGAHAQTGSNPTPNWCSYQATENPSCIQTAPNVASAIGQRVYASGGASTNQSLTTPTITNGTATGTDTSAAIATATSGTVSRTHGAHYSDTTNVMDFGAVASPSADNTAAFQSAITAACAKVSTSDGGTAYTAWGSAGSGDVFVPQGVYGVTGPINWSCPINFHGAGKAATLLVWKGSGSGALLNMSAPLTDSDRYWYHGVVHDIGFVNQGSQTGAVIRTSQCSHCDIYNFSTSGAYRSVVVYAGMWTTIHDFDFILSHVQATNGTITGTEKFSAGIEWYGSDNNGGPNCTASNNGNCLTRGDVLSIYNGYVSANLDGTHEPTDCLYIHDFAGTTWVRGVVCEQVRNGVNVRCDNSVAVGNCPQFMHFDRLEVETNNTVGTNNNYGITADNFGSLECYSCQLYASQAGPNLVSTNASRFPSGNAQFYGGKYQNALGACMVFRSSATTINGGVVLGCGNDGKANDKWGIQFLSSTNNSVSNTQFCHDGVGGIQSDLRPVDIDQGSTYTLVSGSGLQNCAGTSTNQNSSGHNLIVNEVGP